MQTLFTWTLQARSLPLLVRYALTLLLVFATLGAKLALGNLLRPVPFLLFFLPILLAALVFDRGSGFVATAASVALIAYFVLEPVHSFTIADAPQRMDLSPSSPLRPPSF